jgi:formylglycine-generating enzyme required for sulfatase activity
MMRVASATVLALCSMWLCCQPAFAEKRIALVMGNSAYQSVPRLPNPVNDASAMAAMFKSAGFDVVQLKLDLKASDMRRALRDFSDEARDADVAIVYFAGHGIEIQSNNYIVPIDAELERDIDAFDEAIPLDRLLSVIEPAKKLRLIILDACRDNPFGKVTKHVTASRAVARGLAKVEPDSPNTLIAFAAKAGSTAADGDATKNSPFTAALIKYLPTPGLDLRKAFGFVRDDVMKVTRNRQEPFIYGSLGGEDVALVPAPPVPLVDPNAAAKDDYELASQISVVSAWDSFIRKYPSGFYSDLARAQREKLIAAKAAAAEEARLAAEKAVMEQAKATEAEQARIGAQAQAAQDARIVAEKAKADEAAKAAQAREAFEKQNALAEAKAAELARLAAEKKTLDDAKAAEAERARLAAQAKAAQEAKIAAEKARAAEEAKAAQAREAAEKQKALEEAKAAEAKAAEVKAAEAERQRIATQAKAAQEAKIVAEKAKAVEEARAAQAKPETNTRLAAVVTGDPGLGQEIKSQEQRPSSSCAGASPQLTSLSPGVAKTLSLPEECGLKPKDAFKECQNCPEMVVIPAGAFLMGSSSDDIDSGIAVANESPQHKAVVRQPIAVARFEVSRDQFAAFVESSGYKSSGRCFTFEQNIPQERENRSFLNPGYAQDGNHPAVCVSWTDAKAYVDWLSSTTGKSYRLLSETEYEYAARAGGTARYGFGNDPAELCRFANGADQSARIAGLPAGAPYMNCTDGFPFTAPVGSFAANAFGLHDLVGNVWEWTEDCFHGDYATSAADGAAPSEAGCTARAVRGGDWFSTERSLRPAVRAKANADAHHDDIGFRVARTLAR